MRAVVYDRAAFSNGPGEGVVVVGVCRVELAFWGVAVGFVGVRGGFYDTAYEAGVVGSRGVGLKSIGED